ncbi:MAG TPA: hypothetical protein VJ183_03015 [Chloroflexia bacterium]|nr:hypothetical protein [Chloroflexia bacterium]
MVRTDRSTIEPFAGASAIGAGVLTLLYSLGFVVLQRVDGMEEFGILLYSLCQLLGGLVTTAVMVGLYYRLRDVDEAFSLWALLLGVGGALGSAIHGGYDLANAINAPTSDPLGAANLPNQVDPRGLITFGVTAISLFVFSWLITRSQILPKNLGYLGYAVAALFAILYIARLTVLDATNPLIFVPALLTGFLLSPAWYIWLGSLLYRRNRA